MLIKRRVKQYIKERNSALLTYFLRTFDCLAHNLAFAKLHTYNFSVEYLKMMNHLTERKQGLTINDQFSTWMHILFGVPHGSILGPLFFNIIFM